MRVGFGMAGVCGKWIPGQARNDGLWPGRRAGDLERGAVGLEWYQYGMKYEGGTKAVFTPIEHNMDLNTLSI